MTRPSPAATLVATALVAILSAATPTGAWQQQVPPPAAPAAQPGMPFVAQDLEYLIGPGDIVRISVYGNDELNQSVIIQSDGTFLFPLIGRLKAADLTVKELERKVTTLLGDRYIRNPQVTVLLQEYRSKVIYVLGGAARPGTYSLNDARTIVDVAARAGIPNTAEIQVVRPFDGTHGPILPAQVEALAAAASTAEGDEAEGGEGEEGERPAEPERPKAEIITVSLRDIQAGDLSKNIALRPNDTIFVVEAEKVYVSGEVRSPGGYPPPVDATVEQMILLAGGFTDRASRGRIEVEREVDGKRKRRKAHLEDPVLPGDKIRVKAKLF